MDAIEDAKNKLKTILPKPASKLAVRVVIENCTIKISAVSIIEDLLRDYEFFIGKAAELSNKAEGKSFLRAACLTLNAYIEGMVNSLYDVHLTAKSIDKNDKKSKHKKFYQKCEELEAAYLPKKIWLPKAVREELRALRNELTHFSKGDNLFVWDNLTTNNLVKQKQIFLDWINNLHKQMKITSLNTNSEIDMIRLFLAKLGVMTNEMKMDE